MRCFAMHPSLTPNPELDTQTATRDSALRSQVEGSLEGSFICQRMCKYRSFLTMGTLLLHVAIDPKVVILEPFKGRCMPY